MQSVTLDTCAQEPIHVPGSIQPHGVLLACSGPELTVRQASDNVASFLGVELASVLDKPLADLLTHESVAIVADAVGAEQLRAVNPLAVRAANGREFAAMLHRPPDSAGTIVVELEPRAATRRRGQGATFDPRMRSAIVKLQSARTVADLSDIAAEQIRHITGFDRVMVYRFDPDWNGRVVSESRREDLEPFLGLHYPASDIPEQARRLYTVNWLRHIADVGYTPSPLVPHNDPVTSAPLDLSHAVLRSVSPIHIEYLRNMRVTASMSVSLLHEGRLTGLIACHHYAGPWLVPFQVRETAEYLGQALSWQLGALETADEAEHARGIHEIESRIVQRIATHTELLDALATDDLQALTDAQGAAVVLREGARLTGRTPRAAELTEIIRWLQQTDREVFATDNLADELPAARDWDDCAAGMIAVAVSRELGEYLLWFRPSTERTVDWAGDPRKNVTDTAEGVAPRLTPRGSFALWRETVRGRSLPWEPLQIEAASALRRVLLGGIRRRAVELRDINARLLAADREKDAFIATVSHELRTPLNAIAGWTNLLQSGALGPDRTVQALEVIARNVKSQADLVEDLLDVSRMASGKLAISVEQLDLPVLVQHVLDEVALSIESKGLRLKRILDSEASVLGDPDRLRQVAANLITNAVKFTPKGGTITVVLQHKGSDIELSVTDTGRGIAPGFLPHIFEAFRQEDSSTSRRTEGLGLGLAITRKLVELHGGRISAESEGEGRGATFRVILPIAAAHPPAEAAKSAPAADCPPQIEGLRVLIVEDDADSRELLRTMLVRCGAVITAAQSAQDALALLADHEFELIISDIGMAEIDGFELLRRVRLLDTPNARIPAIALTAYTRAVDRTRALRAGFQAHVPKPVDMHELVTVVASLAGRLT